jgi:hypothetical protein
MYQKTVKFGLCGIFRNTASTVFGWVAAMRRSGCGPMEVRQTRTKPIPNDPGFRQTKPDASRRHISSDLR